MRFLQTFRRQKGAASTDPLLGSDAVPTTKAPVQNTDNLLTAKFRDINGWPVQRIGVCWTTQAANPVALNGDMYFWEEALQHWIKINDTALSMKPNQIFFFDIMTVSDPTPTTSTLGVIASAGSIEVFLVVSDPGTAVNGVYTFALAPDLTTVGT